MKGKIKGKFKEEDKIKRLLWCNRHCCLCGKSCGIYIEFAHLPGKNKSTDIDDGIPLCFDCHAEIEAYDSKHPTSIQKEQNIRLKN